MVQGVGNAIDLVRIYDSAPKTKYFFIFFG